MRTFERAKTYTTRWHDGGGWLGVGEVSGLRRRSVDDQKVIFDCRMKKSEVGMYFQKEPVYSGRMLYFNRNEYL